MNTAKKNGAQAAPRPAAPELDPAVGEPIRPSEPLPAPPRAPILDRPIAHAYALVPDPARPGRYFAVHLRDVVAGGYDHIEPSGRSDMIPRGMMRITGAMQARHRARGFADEEET